MCRNAVFVFFVGVVLFCVAAAVYLLADLLVAAAPVVMLARGVAIASVASNTSRRVVGQWGGAGGAICEDHLAFLRWAMGVCGGLTRLEKPEFFNSPKRRARRERSADAPPTQNDPHNLRRLRRPTGPQRAALR